MIGLDRRGGELVSLSFFRVKECVCSERAIKAWGMIERTKFHQRDIKVFMQKFRRRPVRIGKDTPTCKKV